MLGPRQSGQEVRHGLADPGAGFGRQSPAPVEGLGDGAEHIHLRGSRFEVGKPIAQCAAGINEGHQPLDVERCLRRHDDRLHQYVELANIVVDNAGADPLIAELRGNLHIRGGGANHSARVVVNHDIALHQMGQWRRCRRWVTPGNDAKPRHHPVFIRPAYRGHFVTARFSDSGPQRFLCFTGKVFFRPHKRLRYYPSACADATAFHAA